jgi:hypothetical protein
MHNGAWITWRWNRDRWPKKSGKTGERVYRKRMKSKRAWLKNAHISHRERRWYIYTAIKNKVIGEVRLRDGSFEKKLLSFSSGFAPLLSFHGLITIKRSTRSYLEIPAGAVLVPAVHVPAVHVWERFSRARTVNEPGTIVCWLFWSQMTEWNHDQNDGSKTRL